MSPGGRRGNRTPKALADPPVFETGYRACGSPSTVAPAGLEPATSRLRVGCSAVLSYGAVIVALGFLARRCVPVCRWDGAAPHGLRAGGRAAARGQDAKRPGRPGKRERSEEHTSELVT